VGRDDIIKNTPLSAGWFIYTVIDLHHHLILSKWSDVSPNHSQKFLSLKLDNFCYG
jgi:hypothetical protein